MGYTLQIIGGKKLLKALKSDKTIKKPLADGIGRIANKYVALVKQATPVVTGRLRSSIYSNITPERASVGTNVQYAAYVEYGHKQQPGRYVAAIGKRLVQREVDPVHIEGGSRERDKGMFAYAWGVLLEWLGKEKHDIHREIDKEFTK
jgi:hypothetical protein